MVDVPGKEPAHTITYKCPSCRAKLESPAELGGKEDTCPICGTTCPVPMTRRQRAEDRERKAGQALAGAAPTAGPGTTKAARFAISPWLLAIIITVVVAVPYTILEQTGTKAIKPGEIIGYCWTIEDRSAVNLVGAHVGLFEKGLRGKWILQEQTRTDDNGRFSFHNLRPDTYEVIGVVDHSRKGLAVVKVAVGTKVRMSLNLGRTWY